MKTKSGLQVFLLLIVGMVILAGCAGVQMQTSNLVYQAKDKVSDGDLVGSIPVLKKALALNPKDEEANVVMAEVQYRLGHYAKAKQYAQTALSVSPGDFRAIGILGLVDLQNGASEKGIKRVRKAIKIYNGIEPVGGNLPVEPTTMLKQMEYNLKHHKKITKEAIARLANAFWAKIDWYEFDEEYRKWHFKSFYEIRPDGGGPPF